MHLLTSKWQSIEDPTRRRKSARINYKEVVIRFAAAIADTTHSALHCCNHDIYAAAYAMQRGPLIDAPSNKLGSYFLPITTAIDWWSWKW